MLEKKMRKYAEQHPEQTHSPPPPPQSKPRHAGAPARSRSSCLSGSFICEVSQEDEVGGDEDSSAEGTFDVEAAGSGREREAEDRQEAGCGAGCDW